MLYIIPTPIGNREDITLRALRLFEELDFFISEDTRTLKKLYNLYKYDYKSKKFYSFTSFTPKHKIDYYIELIQNNDVGLVSDAGMPGVYDPGKELVRLCRENNIKFEVLPGATAFVPAVVGSCFDTTTFVFMGFLPKKKGKQTKMQEIINSKYPVFIYESVHRVEKTIRQLKDLGFDGKVSIFREISKMFEQKECRHIDTILSMLSSGKIKLKGEFVIGFFSK